MKFGRKLRLLIRTDAPMWAIRSYFLLHIRHRLLNKFSDTGKSYIAKRDSFRVRKEQLKLDNDWFTSNIPTWLRAFETTSLTDKKSIKCLEVGSWQGLSAFFLLSEIPNASLVCVDTWEGADEHKEGSGTNEEILSNVESTFDANLSDFMQRLTKYKGTSLSYYNNEFENDSFDLIYVDGSHQSDDVIVDAVKCFEMLKVGGLIIFDDYFWIHYKMDIDNPAGAINAFLRLKRHQLEIICFDYQIIVRKKFSSSGRFQH